MKIGITCYPTCGGSGVVATERGCASAPASAATGGTATELGCAVATPGAPVTCISPAQPWRLTAHNGRLRCHEGALTPYPRSAPSPPYTLALATKMAEVAAYEK